MRIAFQKISSFHRGMLNELLTDAYAFDGRFQEACAANWREFDDFFFDNARIADSCGFITTLNDEAIGFVSWDPRNMPMYAEVGHNCIASRQKAHGYGKMQLQEALKRISSGDVRKIIVSTKEILIPAQRMYESVGFTLTRRTKPTKLTEFAGDNIHYELDILSMAT